MTGPQQPPFSARHRGQHRHIDADCPATARNGLLHLLLELVEKEYVGGWEAIAREVQRIGRLPPVAYNSSHASILRARADAEEALAELGWDKVYDFCERLHNHLARAVGYHYNDEYQVTTSKNDVQAFIADELQRLFSEERLAFEFTEGQRSRLRCRGRGQNSLSRCEGCDARRSFKVAGGD
jgi:hypothetical protein